MSKSIGKQFEDQFREDVERVFKNMFIYRVPDQMSKMKGSRNICDFFLFVENKLHLIECKTTKSNTLNFSNLSQYEALANNNKYKNVFPAVVI